MFELLKQLKTFDDFCSIDLSSIASCQISFVRRKGISFLRSLTLGLLESLVKHILNNAFYMYFWNALFYCTFWRNKTIKISFLIFCWNNELGKSLNDFKKISCLRNLLYNLYKNIGRSISCLNFSKCRYRPIISNKLIVYILHQLSFNSKEIHLMSTL